MGILTHIENIFAKDPDFTQGHWIPGKVSLSTTPNQVEG
uniref:Uncharacterized protein n=1 Tax=Nelumbo nucifera TaxID=4432 RepID=A0A822YNQ6_NELNU|nr:TPA_asm: hypothetical protein HUJ06_004822 [Nelumbo nucifera]